MDHVVRLVNFMGINSFIQSLCYKMNSLIRISTMWNAIMMDKALCMSMDGCYGRNMKSREGKIHTHNMSIPWRTDLCLFHDGRDLIISLSHGVWLIPPKNSFIRSSKLMSALARHSAVLPRSALVRGSQFCRAYVRLPSLPLCSRAQ